MGSVKVTVFGRIKPRQDNTLSQDYKLKYGDHEDQITFAPSKPTGKKIFRFKKIFGEDATQKQVFEAVAKPVIQNVFEGYNGTIFTYGQTGSGKTHTMTGSLEEWVDTGLIPRTVQEVFRRKENDTVISITYFEIYNEHVYDLIRADRTDSDVSQDAGDDSNTITSFRNLSVHNVGSACEALLLYKRGDANKMVAETSSNARSSRSHVIFAIGFEFPHPKEERISLKPVLYLVDLAGSERISKCKTPMSNPWETRYINLSLHYLEQVLVALRQPGRVHIPYRNSLMTALLRNSLGGNCITAMVATFSLSVDDIDETLQTCRFAERIALIKNEVKLSELTTPQKEIDSLKKENERLKNQLKLISNEQIQEQLTLKDKEKCNEMVQNFLRDNDFFALPLTDIRRMEFCFCLMRNEILKKRTPRSLHNETRGIADGIKIRENKIWSAQEELLQECNREKFDKNPRRRRNPLDIPKVNITYKRWKSTEHLSGYGSSKKGSEKAGQQSSGSQGSRNQGQLTNVAPHNRDMKKSAEYLQEKDFAVTTRPKSSNFDLKFSGESKKGNINSFNVSGSNDSEKHDFTEAISCKKPANPRIPWTSSFGESSECATCTGIQRNYETFFVKNSEPEQVESNDQFSAKCVPLTGDKEVDEEILKFYKSRYQIFKEKEKV